MNEQDDSIIKEGEHHPSADEAMKWFRAWEANTLRYMQTREAIASVALSGNRTAQICNGTLDRLERGEPVSDRYLLGLCWMLREMEEKDQG
jgi:hypothetical protein